MGGALGADRMSVQLYLGDCLEILPTLEAGSVDAVITDPPYPDYYTEEFQYRDGLISWLADWDCRQCVFWTAKDDFPLPFTARHVWDKITGAACQYDFIYERNGYRRQKVSMHSDCFHGVVRKSAHK